MQEKKSKIRNNKHLDNGITFIALILTIIALIVIIILISTTSSERKINKDLLIEVEKDRAEIEELVKQEVTASTKDNLIIDWKILQEKLEKNVKAKNIKFKNEENKENRHDIRIRKK